MGRHAAPGPDSPTDVIPLQQRSYTTNPLKMDVADVAAWYRAANRKARIGAVGAVAGLVAVFVGGQIANDHSGSTSPAEVAQNARMQGWSYGAELRDAGYSSTYVLSSCVNTDYTGSNLQDYKNGCIGVVFQMQDHGR